MDGGWIKLGEYLVNLYWVVAIDLSKMEADEVEKRIIKIYYGRGWSIDIPKKDIEPNALEELQARLNQKI